MLASDRLLGKTSNPQILNDVFGSDHCPVSLDLNL